MDCRGAPPPDAPISRFTHSHLTLTVNNHASDWSLYLENAKTARIQILVLYDVVHTSKVIWIDTTGRPSSLAGNILGRMDIYSIYRSAITDSKVPPVNLDTAPSWTYEPVTSQLNIRVPTKCDQVRLKAARAKSVPSRCGLWTGSSLELLPLAARGRFLRLPPHMLATLEVKLISEAVENTINKRKYRKQ